MSQRKPAEPATLAELLAPHPATAPALRWTSGEVVTYGSLRDRTESAVEAFNNLGIGRGDSVAMVLGNGPHMAAAFVAVASTAAAAPLHPGLRAGEFRDSFESIRAKAVLVEAGIGGPAAEAARKIGVPVIELKPSAPDGGFSLGTGAAGDAERPGPAEPDDTALLLHTSGTTARPKLVPLTHANLSASSQHIASTLHLGPGDACLNVMPLFHIHGLVGALLASLRAGAEVIATPGFDGLRFFQWLAENRPTWYSAVPTMHQAILRRASRHAAALDASPLRLIRSSSAALPPQVLGSLEEAFGCPVLESYGMTEAAHQMTSNPLPPKERKPGTVGPAAGPEVAVMDPSGRMLPAGETGEVVIRGPNVTGGYVAHPTANAEAFEDGWFRTGDEGFCDADGYFTITGRLKELINRGGEKISPREIDETLLDHPSVAQAVAFAAPHEQLGEEVAVAIVAEPGATLTARAVRDFASERLAAYKVPRKVVFVDEIPKGPSGKLKRVGLAAELGIN